MASRFAFEKLSSMSRLRSLLGAHAPAAVRGSAPATHTASVARHFHTIPGSRAAATRTSEDEFWRRFMWICGFSCFSCAFGLLLEEWASSYKDQSSSPPCASCCDGQRAVPK